MNFEKLKGKTMHIDMCGGENESFEGEISISEYGEEFFHIEDITDNEDDPQPFEIFIGSAASMYEVESEEEVEEEEAPEEEKPIPKGKYSDRSVHEIPAKKKKGLFGF